MKNKIVTYLSSEKQIYESVADVFIIALKDISWRTNKYFTMDELANLSQKIEKEGKEVWVLFNGLYKEEELVFIRKCLTKIKTMEVDGIVYSSMAIYQIVNTLGIKDILVYQADSLITNSYDGNFFAQDHKAVIVAPLITLEAIKTITSKQPEKFGIIIHGFLNLSISARKFISNYFNHMNISEDLKQNFFIKEETRDSYMPILQEDRGTSIFSGWILTSIKEIEELKVCCRYLIVENLFINAEDLEKTIKIYRNLLDNKIDMQKALNDLPIDQKHPLESGYYYRQTAKAKKETEDE